MNVLFWGPGNFPVSYSKKEHMKSSFRTFYGQYGDLFKQYEVSLSRMLNGILTLDQLVTFNRSDFPQFSSPWYQAWPSPNYEWFQWSIYNWCGMPAGNAYPSWYLVSTLFGDLLMLQLLRPLFLNLSCLFLDFLPLISLSTFSILLGTCIHSTCSSDTSFVEDILKFLFIQSKNKTNHGHTELPLMKL